MKRVSGFYLGVLFFCVTCFAAPNHTFDQLAEWYRAGSMPLPRDFETESVWKGELITADGWSHVVAFPIFYDLDPFGHLQIFGMSHITVKEYSAKGHLEKAKKNLNFRGSIQEHLKPELAQNAYVTHVKRSASVCEEYQYIRKIKARDVAGFIMSHVSVLPCNVGGTDKPYAYSYYDKKFRALSDPPEGLGTCYEDSDCNGFLLSNRVLSYQTCANAGGGSWMNVGICYPISK